MRIRIRAGQKHADPADPDPKPCLNVDSDLQAEESPPRRQSLLWSQEMEAKVADYSITFVNDIPQENSPFFKGKERWSL